MAEDPAVRPGGPNTLLELRGAARLVVDATRGVTDVVEAMHSNIARVPGLQGPSSSDRTAGISGFVYRRIHGVTRLVGGSVDALLGALELLPGGAVPDQGNADVPAWRDNLIAAVNGVLGDHLDASGNPLALPMNLFRDGRPLILERAAIEAGGAPRADHLLVLVHGLCMNDRHWHWKGLDLGAELAAHTGCLPLYLRYNTGRHVSINGADLARLLTRLIDAWPVPVRRLSLLTHSMGGLVARSAIHQARQSGMAWPDLVSQVFFLGTPHHGASLERAGHLIDLALGAHPYSAALARLGKIRSAGITDLRYGSLLEADWRDLDRFGRAQPRPAGLALPEGIACYAIAGSTSRPSTAVAYARGDGLVSLRSALGVHKDPARCLAFGEQQQWIGHGLGHFDLLGSREVCQRLLGWMAAPEEAA